MTLDDEAMSEESWRAPAPVFYPSGEAVVPNPMGARRSDEPSPSCLQRVAAG